MRRAVFAGVLLSGGCYREQVTLLCPIPDAPACAREETSTGETVASSTTGTTAADDTSSTAPGETSGTIGASETTEATSTSTTATSTETGPACGDGVVEGAEECDGGPGCSECWRDRVVFVTSEKYTADFIGGLVGADALCRGLAVKSGLANGPSFRAWLSSTSEDPASRFYRHPGRYVLVNGLVVAEGWDELVSGALQNPINATETGQIPQALTWTGTLPDGTRRPDSQQCEDWTSLQDDADGYFGVPSFADANWTMAAPEYLNPGPCLAMRALYCFEQE